MSLWKKQADPTPPVPPDNPAETGSAADVEEMMKRYDRESNTREWEGVPKWIVRFVMVLFSLVCLYLTLINRSQAEVRMTIFLGMIVIIGYLNFPLRKGHVKVNSLPFYDIIIMIAGSAPFFYFALNCQKIMNTSYTKITKNPVMLAMAIVGILAMVELCRRSVGLPILCVVGALLIYTFSNVRFGKVIYDLFFTTNGILGTPISVCQKYIVVFIIFGAFLERTGISNFFINLANCVAGSSSGGPAKVAVISSALCGMVSGSSVGNTVTTGSVTIPMMKKTGYQGEFAGAVEAAASTGGQIMPPIMGAAAFLMAEYTGIPYATIALLAILPAVLYFTGIYIAVHLEAKKLGLRGLRRDELPEFKHLVKKIYLLLPLVVLVALVSNGARTMQSSAAIAILITILVGVVNNIVNAAAKSDDTSDNISLQKIVEALEAGAKGTITVAAACAMAGVVAGCITSTGLASRLLRAIVSVSGGVTIVALLLTMLCCIVLGMGVPTTANYCIMASTCAPILMSEAIGVPMLAAHFFVFYFGIVADITPPVALAAYAGAAIAKAPPMKTAFNATRLAIGAFIVPYIFALNPAMLLIDAQWYDVALITVTALMGIFGVAAGLGGFVFKPLKVWERVLFIAGGLTLLVPGLVTDLIGLALVAAVGAVNYMGAKKVN